MVLTTQEEDMLIQAVIVQDTVDILEELHAIPDTQDITGDDTDGL